MTAIISLSAARHLVKTRCVGRPYPSTFSAARPRILASIRDTSHSAFGGVAPQMTEGGRPGDQEGGLVPGHAYSLISARKLHSGAEILKLRNPWGTFEWQGAWSDNSPEVWTDWSLAGSRHSRRLCSPKASSAAAL
eukprot:scaffold110628_cov30-Tisochrysis_lutea.AAC.4